MLHTPKIAGFVDAALKSSKHNGGTARLLLGAIVETIFGLLLTSISMVGQSIFMAALLFGKTISWDGQRRDRYRLSWGEAAKVLWPHTLFGFAILILLAVGAPGAIVWFLPFIAGPLLSIPFAVLTALPELGAVAARLRFCGIPEEFDMPRDLAKILPRAGT
jgi:membrane glycosyltransferase